MQRLTKASYEIKKEIIEQEMRGLDIDILEVKREIKEQNLEAVRWDLETAKEGVRKSKIAYESARTSNDIAEQKLNQLNDALEFERAMTILNQQNLMVQGQSALLSLQQAQAELEANKALFELKYDMVIDLQLPR